MLEVFIKSQESLSSGGSQREKIQGMSSPLDMDRTHQVRIVMLGQSGVGKTAILSQFLHQKFEVSIE